MRILGNRVLVSRVEEEKKDGFQTVEVQDSFVYKGKIEILSQEAADKGFNLYHTVLFTKYSPDTQEIDHEGQKMKIIKIEDILAIL